MALLKNPNDIDNSKIKKLVKEWTRTKLLLSHDVIITVTELKCAEPNCPDVETIIVIYKENETLKFKIGKPLTYVRKWDIDGLKTKNN